MNPEFFAYKKVASHVNEDTFYADIINHYSGRLNYPDRMTEAHETTHMINADLRNMNGGKAAFYIGQDLAVIMPEPKMRKHMVQVPPELRGPRYATYITGQTEWDDRPLYICDEWQAYTNGGIVCIEQVQNNTYKSGWTDGVMGLLEFSAYVVLLTLAIERNDSGYLTSTPNFLAYADLNLKTAFRTYRMGSIMDQFKWDVQDKYLAALRANSVVTDALNKYFNGVWVSDPPIYKA